MNALSAQGCEDQFGRRVAARLSASTAELPHDISERLRVARLQAVSRRKITAPVQGATDRNRRPAGEERLGFWDRLASALPVVLLAAGLVAINLVQNEHRAVEVAEVDAQLLTDDLPPSAYADPGFVEYLKAGASKAH